MASLCLISVEETTSASNQLLTFSPLSFGHPGLPGVSKTMEDNGGKLKKLEKGSARVSPNVVFFFQHFLTQVVVTVALFDVMFLYITFGLAGESS